MAFSATDARSSPGPSGSLGSVTISLAPVASAAGGSRASSSSNTGPAGRNTTGLGSLPRRLKAFSTSASVPEPAGSLPGTAKGVGETGSLTWTRIGSLRVAPAPGAGRQRPVHEIAEQVVGGEQAVAFRRLGSWGAGDPDFSFRPALMASRPWVRLPDSISRPRQLGQRRRATYREEPAAGYHARPVYNPLPRTAGDGLPGGWIGTGWISSSAFSTAHSFPGSWASWPLLVGYKFLSERVKIRAPVGVNREDLVSRLLGPGWAKKKIEREVARLKKQANYLGAGQAARGAGPPRRRRRGVSRRPGDLGGGIDLREDGARREGGRALPAGGRPQEGGGALQPGRQARAGGGALPRERQQPRGCAPLRRGGPVEHLPPSSTRRAATRCARRRRGRRTASRSRPPRPTRSTSPRTSASRRATRNRRALRTPRARSRPGGSSSRPSSSSGQRRSTRGAATTSRPPRCCSSSGRPGRPPSCS